MLNDCTFCGRLVRDPELRRTGSGIAVTSFTLAVERDIAGQDGKRETDFIDFVAWREKGEFVAKYFKKGSMAIAKGRMQSREWTDKQGSKRKSWEIQVDGVYFAGSKKDEDNQTGQRSNYGQSSYGGYTGSQNTGYGGYGGTYSPPQSQTGDFAMLEDDDAQLPF